MLLLDSPLVTASNPNWISAKSSQSSKQIQARLACLMPSDRYRRPSPQEHRYRKSSLDRSYDDRRSYRARFDRRKSPENHKLRLSAKQSSVEDDAKRHQNRDVDARDRVERGSMPLRGPDEKRLSHRFNTYYETQDNRPAGERRERQASSSPSRREEKRRRTEEAPQVKASLDDEQQLKDYAEKKIAKVTVDTIGRAGGVYIPPHKLAQLQKVTTDKSSPEYQRQSWEALRKSINGLVNKVNTKNITNLIQELFRENLVRGRGLFARAIIRAQMASPGFTHIYAAVLSIVNSKLPETGDLVIRRILLQFRRAYRRNDKIVCAACVKFIAHLINQKVIHELLALQLAMLLLEKLTDDSIDACITFMKEVGQVLRDISPKGFNAISERLRSILQEGLIDQRVQYKVIQFFDVYANKFKDYPGVVSDLDLVEEEDQITHEVDLLDPDVKGDEMLNIFKAVSPEEFLKNEEEWNSISREILGDDSGVGQANEDDSGSVTSEDSEADNESEKIGGKILEIKDFTEQDIIQLRKSVYLTIQSSATFEESVHKILKMNIKEGCEVEVCTMLIDCCAMERTFQRFFALQAERLSKLNTIYQGCFLECLQRQYQTVHRLETSKLRNTAKFFSHLFSTDAVPWTALELFHLTEEATTSASRIFIKVLFQDLAENMGLEKLNCRLQEPGLAPFLQAIFPTDHPKNIRFSINFFTAIGLGCLTDPLREILQGIQQRIAAESADEESSGSSTSNDDCRSRR